MTYVEQLPIGYSGSVRRVLCLALAACGRLGFDTAASADGADGDANNALTYRDLIVAAGPVAYFRLGDPGPTMADEMGGAPGILSGGCASFVGAIKGDPDLALELDGTSCLVDLDNRFEFVGLSPFSIEGWVQAPDDLLGGTFQHVWTRQRRGAGPINGYAMAWNESTGLFLERVISRAGLETNPVILSVGYVYAVSTYDGVDMKLYVDGVERATEPDARSLQALDENAYIGAGPDFLDPAANFFRGKIDEISIYDRALLTTEIAQHHAAGLRE